MRVSVRALSRAHENFTGMYFLMSLPKSNVKLHFDNLNAQNQLTTVN